MVARGALGESVCGRARELIEVDGLDPEPERLLVGPGDEEQVVREEGEPVGLLRRGAHRCSELVCGAGAPERELELGLQESEGRTQLMARVGNKTPLVLERGLEPRQHLVEGLRQITDLVAAGRHRESGAGRGRGDRARAAPHRLDGT